MASFDCDMCGACCRSLFLFPELSEFDTGDGTCQNLEAGNVCAIYDTRPTVCSSDKLYDKFSARAAISKNDFFALLKGSCDKMQARLSLR